VSRRVADGAAPYAGPLVILGELVTSRELLRNLVLRDLRGRYKRSALGMLWSLINPLASMAIYATVFKYVVKAQPAPGNPSGLKNFALWLLCGLLPWAFFSISTSAGMRAIVENAGLVRKVWFPRHVLVAGAVGALQVTFLIELGLLAIVLTIAGNAAILWIPVLIPILVLLLIFTLGVTLTLASLYVYFRDLAHLWTVIVQAGFYAVPVIYPLSLLHGVPLTLVRLNPITVFVSAIRNVFYDLRFPPATHWLYMAAWAVAMFVLGTLVFRKAETRFAEEI
jgi:ABC-2 type transport system permease protein